MLAFDKISRIVGTFNLLMGLLLLALALHMLFFGVPGDTALGGIMAAIASGLAFFGLMLSFLRRWARLGLVTFYALVLCGLLYATWDEYQSPTDPYVTYPFFGFLALIATLNIALMLSKPLEKELNQNERPESE